MGQKKKDFEVIKFPSLTSTQEKAREFLTRSPSAWLVILAERQEKGKGRGGREFFSPPGGLYFSLLLQEESSPHHLLFALSSAVAEAIRELTGVEVLIKWPNDFVVGKRKIGGILLEKAAENWWWIVGVGINLNSSEKDFPSSLRGKIITLKDILGKLLDPEKLLFKILENIRKEMGVLKEKGFSAILRKWEHLSLPLGSRITLHRGKKTLEGYYWGVGEEGEVYIRTEEGRVLSFTTGDLEIT